MSEFRFKSFSLQNELSPMKVNTDGVLLGAMASLPVQGAAGRDFKAQPFKVLDVGTGTGVIALMIAQRLSGLPFSSCGAAPEGFCAAKNRVLNVKTAGAQDCELEGDVFDFQIEGIDIDEKAFLESSANFAASPWSARLLSYKKALADISHLEEKYDLILSNPPYYDDSLPNPDQRKRVSRHFSGDRGLSYETLAAFASENLSGQGVLSIILPCESVKNALRSARYCGLRLIRQVNIRSTERKPFSRTLMEFGLFQRPHNEAEKILETSRKATKNRLDNSANLLAEELTLMLNGSYTDTYRAIVKDFYLWA